jgi:hypothetical protein
MLAKVGLIIAAIILLGNTIAISRDFQDSWILEGLEIPFAIFFVVYAVTFFSEARTSWVVALAVLGRIVFLLVPNLKYTWFQGIFIDQHMQYALANHVYNTGHVASFLATGEPSQYIYTPLMHLFFSTFSTVLNVPIVASMKFLPILWSPIYPLLTYVLVKRSGFLQKRAFVKYALFFSSLPFVNQYVVTGALMGSPLVLLTFISMILAFREKDRRFWLICLIFAVALAMAHSVSSVVFAGIILVIPLLQKVARFRTYKPLRMSQALTIITISATWLMFSADIVLRVMVGQVFYNVPSGMTPGSERISPTFFQHLQVNPLSALRSVIAYFGADILFLIISTISLIVFFRMRKKLSQTANYVSLLGWASLMFVVVGSFIQLGGPRALLFMTVVSICLFFILYIIKDGLSESGRPTTSF